MSLFVVFPPLPAPSLCVCFQQQVPRGAPSIRPPWLWSVSSAAWSAWFTALTSPAASQCGWSYMCPSTSSLTVRLSHQPQTADAAFSTHTSVGAQSPGGGEAELAFFRPLSREFGPLYLWNWVPAFCTRCYWLALLSQRKKAPRPQLSHSKCALKALENIEARSQWPPAAHLLSLFPLIRWPPH